MVDAVFHPSFKRLFSKNKTKAVKKKLIKQFQKIREDPEIGKPMKYGRRGTREVYVASYRLSYKYVEEEDKILFLDLYHKDEQ